MRPKSITILKYLLYLIGSHYASLGAHSACQLSTAGIRRTWEWAAISFHSVQQGTVFVGMATRNILWIPINTNEVAWMLVVMISSHQVPMILLDPSRWTVIPSRHHQHRATWLDETDDALRITIVKISLKRVSVVIIHFIFSAVHVSSGLMAIFVLVLCWIVRKAKIARSTTRVIVGVSTHYTWCEQQVKPRYYGDWRGHGKCPYYAGLI